MTVVVAVAAPDGIILAADSRTTVQWEAGGRHRIMSDATQKVIAVGERIGVAIYGNAFIGNRTIAGLMDEFVAQRAEQMPETSEAVAQALGDFFHERFMADSPPELLTWCEENPGSYPLGFLVAGYDEEGIGTVREVGIPAPYIGAPEIDTASLGVSWRGQTDVIRRLVKGFDADQFVGGGNVLPDDLTGAVAGLEYSLLLPITMQDAVDLGRFLVRATIDMQRFSDGTFGNPGSLPGCGGSVRVLSVTRAGGAEWIAVPAITADGDSGIAEGGLGA